MTTSPQVAREIGAMLSGMTPMLADGEFIYCTTTDENIAGRACGGALAWFREKEGVSLILARTLAADFGFACDMPMRRIVLEVFSSLEGVGLTAAVASALSAHGIPCNMVAAYHHDHIFVPSDKAELAMEILTELQQSASACC